MGVANDLVCVYVLLSMLSSVTYVYNIQRWRFWTHSRFTMHRYLLVKCFPQLSRVSVAKGVGIQVPLYRGERFPYAPPYTNNG